MKTVGMPFDMRTLFLTPLFCLLIAGCSHTSTVAEMNDVPQSCRPKAPLLPVQAKPNQDPFMEAIFEENTEKLKSLIQSGRNIPKKDALGFSYLHLAAGVGNSEIIELLIKAGISVNTKSGKKQSTPAHSAVSWGKLTSLHALRKHGADFSLTNSDGKSPAALAQELKNSEIIDFFHSQSRL